jgi:hypothetical protein
MSGSMQQGLTGPHGYNNSGGAADDSAMFGAQLLQRLAHMFEQTSASPQVGQLKLTDAVGLEMQHGLLPSYTTTPFCPHTVFPCRASLAGSVALQGF